MKVALADKNDDWYGTIVRYVDSNHIMIDIPVSDDKKQLTLSEGVELEFRFSRFLGMYTFKSKFEEAYEYLDLAIIEKPVEIFKIRSRKYVRVPVNIKVMIDQRNGNITNLSAEGLYIVIDHKYSIGDTVQIDFRLEKTEISLKGMVVRLGDDNGYGIKFTEIGQDKVNLIDHYALKKVVIDLFLD